MDQAVFEAELKSAGYSQIETKALGPNPGNTEHAHDYDVRGLVLDGIFIVREGKSVTYRAGEIFAAPARTKHSEEIGGQGAHIIVGRKY
jgi:hypothetical protein